MDNFVITIARQYGSGGRTIGEELAKKLGISYYDKDIIREVSESGTTVLLVEQNAKKALSIADRAYVLETGSITMDGKAEDLLNDEAVQKAYLGE